MTQLYPDSGQNNDCVIFVFDCINKSVFFIDILEQHVSKCRIRTLLLLMMLRPVICDFLHDFKILRLFTQLHHFAENQFQSGQSKLQHHCY